MPKFSTSEAVSFQGELMKRSEPRNGIFPPALLPSSNEVTNEAMGLTKKYKFPQRNLKPWQQA